MINGAEISEFMGNAGYGAITFAGNDSLSNTRDLTSSWSENDPYKT